MHTLHWRHNDVKMSLQRLVGMFLTSDVFCGNISRLYLLLKSTCKQELIEKHCKLRDLLRDTWLVWSVVSSYVCMISIRPKLAVSKMPLLRKRAVWHTKKAGFLSKFDPWRHMTYDEEENWWICFALFPCSNYLPVTNLLILSIYWILFDQ